MVRAQHASGVAARVVNGGETIPATICWSVPQATQEALQVIDTIRVTEDGAEGVALAFVHERSRWTVDRRVQRDGYADWLLSSPSQQQMALVLEVSGTEVGSAQSRLHEKLAQVAKGAKQDRRIRAAVVVGFDEPCVLAAIVGGGGVP